MSQSNSDKKRLAKNTILLYGRTIIVMFISLYVSRLILNILGVTDYGVYNAVGGIVGMLSLVSTSLVAATQRYISFELGKKDGNPSYIFSLAMGFHLFIALVVFLLAETIGIWFLNNYMNLPSERMVAANWVFQFSVISFIFNLITIPYNAIIIAQERMGVFAVISIVEALLKLGFAFVLLVAFSDKLIYYAVSAALIHAIIFSFNAIYCKLKFRECCIFKLEKEIAAYRHIGGFIGWNFIGSTATVLSKQGVNVLLNIFCGVIVNAGRGVASQVDNAVNQFINSFTTAIRPQITKTYAAQEYRACFSLVNQGTKLIIYLTLLFVIPLALRTEFVLTLWLKTVPDYAVLFTRLSLMIVALDALSTPLYFLMLSTGKIKGYQLVAGSLGLLTFPLTWIALKLGVNPEVSYYILAVIDVFRWVFQLIFLKRIAHFDVTSYLKEAMAPIMLVFVLAASLIYILDRIIPEGLIGLLLFLLCSSIVFGICVFFIGLKYSERNKIVSIVLNKFVNNEK